MGLLAARGTRPFAGSNHLTLKRMTLDPGQHHVHARLATPPSHRGNNLQLSGQHRRRACCEETSSSSIGFWLFSDLVSPHALAQMSHQMSLGEGEQHSDSGSRELTFSCSGNHPIQAASQVVGDTSRARYAVVICLER